MNSELISLLKTHIGVPLSAGLAAEICVAAGRIETLVPTLEISRVRPESYKGCTFSLERIEAIVNEIRPLHQAHWNETEAHRHGLQFNPDYPAFIRYERAGRYVLLTLRIDGNLSGNCAMYLDKSTHTQTLIATEDTLYLSPEARKGRVASHFVAYMESVMRQLGAREIHITVKTVNKAGRFFQMLGYRHVENGLTKILEV
ncbi:GNAT family N-acetyltransferase [Nitrosovibrio tenuis]|uniref:Acetyltransferase (GNAT) family protein n=1 Tax=Nitrosovibrio tenuis TaxID=1233 RepID=A0A1H7IVK1_9PROT|nr:GNAT family N-acetyltransferase [Nitrosovibrio tenuis]SEK64805.1 Acetyltransferase (GNAT) family protein [Nitrosovibrio tenuis]